MTNPISQYLGYGVNAANSSYLDIYAFTSSVVNVSDQNYSFTTENNGTVQNTTSSYTQLGYLQSQSVSAGISGGYAGFSGSLQTQFDTSYSTLQQTWYSTTQTTVTIGGATLTGSADLNTQFEEHLNDASLTPAQLYQKYGAYYLAGCKQGGYCNSYMTTQNTTSCTSKNLQATAQATYNDGIQSGQVDTGYSYTDTTTGITMNSASGIVVAGGDSPAPFDLSTWENSVSSDNAAIISWDLKPIYLLASTPARRNQLKAALPEYFTNNLAVNCITGPISASITLNSQQFLLNKPWKLLGGGAGLQPSNSNQFLNQSYSPPGTDNQWSASSNCYHNATSQTMQIGTIATYDPGSLLDVQVFQKTFTLNPDNGNQNQASYSFQLPDESYIATCGGFSVPYDGSKTHVFCTACYPDSSSPTLWHFTFFCPTGQMPNWEVTLTVQAVRWNTDNAYFDNSESIPALQWQVFESEVKGMQHLQEATVGAATEYTLVGGGAQITNADNQTNASSYLVGNWPTVDLNKNLIWSAWSHDAATSVTANLTVYAVGLGVRTNQNTIIPFGAQCLTKAGYQGT